MDLTLTELAASIRSGEQSAEAVTRQCLAEIERGAGALNCFVRVDADGALERARDLDRDFARGRVHGPLHGVPLAHKDMFYRAGRVSAFGSTICGDFRPAVTSTLLTRFDAAGAVEIGQLHMAEFALSPTGYNLHLGPCRNPWHRDHITGGSSSGSGAAVAAGFVSGALGSDTGGSVRIPAAACGVTGLKPTQHLLSTHGVMPLSPSQDCMGILARSVADCALLFDTVNGHDAADPTCMSAPGRPKREYLRSRHQAGAATRAPERYALQRPVPPAESLRIGVPRFDDCPDVTAEVGQVLAEAGRALRTCGFDVRDAAIPSMAPLNTMSTLILGAEAASFHADWLRTRQAEYAPQVRRRIVRGLFYPGVAYVDALRLRPLLLEEFLARHFADADALLVPVLPGAVPTIEETTTGSEQEIEAVIGSLSYWTRGINYLGLPALALPAGFAANGLPVGVQLVGRPCSEMNLFRIGERFQQATDWHQRRPREAVTRS